MSESALARVLASKPAWWHRNQEPKRRGIMLRCSDSQLELLQRAAEDGETSQQKVLERLVWPVLEDRYGNVPEGESEEELERRRDETKTTYLAAVNELFRLLSLSAAEKGQNHKELVAAANDACGTARVAMLKVWEGDDESWQR